MATNSIIIANLPDWAPKTPNTEDGPGSGPESPSMILPFTFIESLRAVIEGYRAIVHWIPMRRSVPPMPPLKLVFAEYFVCL